MIRINGVSSHFFTNSSDMGTDPQVWVVCRQIRENWDRKLFLSLFAFLDLFLYCCEFKFQLFLVVFHPFHLFTL